MKIEEALDSLGDKLYHYLTIKLGSPQDAEDVLQEVFYRLIRYKLRFRLIRNLSAYLFRMARNEAADFLKKRKKDQKIRYKEMTDGLINIEHELNLSQWLARHYRMHKKHGRLRNYQDVLDIIKEEINGT
jgi:RNA polymerase sigma factor (sigma-70 family)